MESTRASHADFLGQRRFGSLDGVRALCIAGVVWHHTAPAIPALASPEWTLLRRGFLGVDAFFVLSGFLIVTLLLRERDRSGSVDLRRFWARRSLRIFPLYYAVLGVLVVFSWLALGSGSRPSETRQVFALASCSSEPGRSQS